MTALEDFNAEFAAERLIEIFNGRFAHSRTVGKDGIHAGQFQQNLLSEVQLITTKVRSGSYNFTTFKQKLILKGAGKAPREISIATVRDRLTLRALTNVLMTVFQDARLHAAHHIVDEVARFIKPLDDNYAFIQIDIKDFYPSVQHAELLRRLRTRIRYQPLLNLISNAVRTPTSDDKETKPNTRGIPQGLSISNVLSSIYMMKFDQVARNRFTYFRYVDDILIICRAADAKRHFCFIESQLMRIGLECHPLKDNSKTKIVPLSHGVDYLGYRLTPSLVSVRKSSYRKMIKTLMTVITGVKYNANDKRVLTRLNLKITGCVFDAKRMGWMFFFSKTDDIKQLKRLDSFVEKHWRRLGMEKYGHPKKFVKAYHEINFNFENSKYIPRFDEYTKDQKIDLIVMMQARERDVVERWSIERINREFFKIVKKEASELEKDMTPTS